MRRVVQWATGNIGTRSLRSVIEHPHLELVGLWVHTSDKVGRDAGELCGLDPVGVRATHDIEEIVALQPDCVLYMAHTTDLDEICRLLESGANVVTTRGDFHRPASMDPAARDRVESACIRGGTSIHSTGSSPGFITEAVPLVLTSLQRRLDSLTIDEFADLSQRNSPAMIFDVLGFGRPPGKFGRGRLTHAEVSFGPSLSLIADALGAPLDALEASGELAVAARTVEIAAGMVEAGTVAGQRLTVAGMRNGQPLLRFRATWYCTTELDVEWDLLPSGWRISLEGDAPLQVEMRLSFPLERMAEMTPGYTAHRAVNAVPVVCDAAPGIRTTVDLPQIIAQLG